MQRETSSICSGLWSRRVPCLLARLDMVLSMGFLSKRKKLVLLGLGCSLGY